LSSIDVRQDVPTRSRRTRIFLVFFATSLVWVYRIFDCAWGSGAGAGQAFGNARAVQETFQSSGDELVAVVIMAVLFSSHLRVFFGVEFADRDRTFHQAMDSLPPPERQRLQAVGGFTLAVMAAATVLLSYFVSSSNHWLVTITLLVEAGFLFWFDRKHKRVLLEIDPDRKANKYIVFNDYVFIFIAAIFLCASLRISLGIGFSLSGIWFILFVAPYLCLFGMECALEYKSPVGEAVSDLCWVVKEAVGSKHQKTTVEG